MKKTCQTHFFGGVLLLILSLITAVNASADHCYSPKGELEWDNFQSVDGVEYSPGFYDYYEYPEYWDSEGFPKPRFGSAWVRSDASGSVSIRSSFTIHFTLTWYTEEYDEEEHEWIDVEHKKSRSITFPVTFASFSDKNPYISSISIPNSVENTSFSFAGYTSLTSVSLPNSVESLDFTGCTSLTSVTLPNSVTSLSFNGCTSLKSVPLLNSLESLDITDCPSLQSIIIPYSLTSLRNYNYYAVTTTNIKTLVWNARNCPNNIGRTQIIESVTIGEGVEALPSGFVKESKVKSVVIPNSVTSIGAEAFYNCTDLESVTLGTGIKNIGDYMFHECHALCNVTIPNSVNRIGKYAFDYCDGLEEITIPSSVKTIDEGAFHWCSGLKNVVVPEGVDTIGKRAFYYCREMRSVELPASLSFIGAYAFFSDEYLGDVTCHATTPPRIENNDCFYPAYSSGYADATLHVPASSVEEYKNAKYWKNFNHINPITVAILITGDVDGDGAIGITDVADLIDLILGGDVDIMNYPAADMDGDGKIGISDVSDIIDRLLSDN